MFLAYLTGFAWSYMFAILFTRWVYSEHGGGYAAGLFIMLLPLPGFFLFQLTRALLGLNPNAL